MKVRELIEELKRHDPEKPVVVDGYEGGCDDVSLVEEIRLNLNVNTEVYFGKHEQGDAGECPAIRIG